MRQRNVESTLLNSSHVQIISNQPGRVRCNTRYNKNNGSQPALEEAVEQYQLTPEQHGK
jgi:hypothetical protein